MKLFSATALAHPNIAFIKYWGNRDDDLRLPLNGSISMNLAELTTRTRVRFDPEFPADAFTLNNTIQSGPGLERVARFLDILRKQSGIPWYAQVDSVNNYPTGAGIASSAAGFAALALAGASALGLEFSEAQLSALARRGSGSACRSIPAGYVEWLPGTNTDDSYAYSIAPASYWDLVDCIAVVSESPKSTGSSEGHRFAVTSPLQAARVAGALDRLSYCRQALLARDFESLAAVIELDSNLMHAVMMTSSPPLLYWEPISVAIMKIVPEWRKGGLAACYTLDAGPNVHVLCTAADAPAVKSELEKIPGVVQVILTAAGGGARLTPED